MKIIIKKDQNKEKSQNRKDPDLDPETKNMMNLNEKVTIIKIEVMNKKKERYKFTHQKIRTQEDSIVKIINKVIKVIKERIIIINPKKIITTQKIERQSIDMISTVEKINMK